MASSTTILALTLFLIFHITLETTLARPLNDQKATDGVVTTTTDEANNYSWFSNLQSSPPTTVPLPSTPSAGGGIPGFPGFMFPFPFPSSPSAGGGIPGFPGFRFPFPFPSSPSTGGGIPGFPGFRFPFPSSPSAGGGIPGFPGFRFPFPFPSSPSTGGSIPGFPGFRFPPLPFLMPPPQ